jgi:hypothetical protein
MFAIIYDDHDMAHPLKRVMSTHATRKGAQGSLDKHRKTHGADRHQCNMRIVWLEEEVAVGDSVTPRQFETWRPGEAIPEGELRSDGD